MVFRKSTIQRVNGKLLMNKGLDILERAEALAQDTHVKHLELFILLNEIQVKDYYKANCGFMTSEIEEDVQHEGRQTC